MDNKYFCKQIDKLNHQKSSQITDLIVSIFMNMKKMFMTTCTMYMVSLPITSALVWTGVVRKATDWVAFWYTIFSTGTGCPRIRMKKIQFSCCTDLVTAEIQNKNITKIQAKSWNTEQKDNQKKKKKAVC